MSFQIIDTVSPASFYYDEQVNLEGALYTLGFYWNERAGAWFFSIDDPDGNPIVHGLRLTAGRALLKQSVYPKQPPGAFYVFDSSGQDLDPGKTDLGTRVQLLYIPAADVTTILAGGTP